MIKYTDYKIVFEEIPDRITLAINISNCQCNCKGCHSPQLRNNIGEELTKEVIDNKFCRDLKLCNCFLFLGEGNDNKSLFEINQYIKEKYNIETAIYTGRDNVEEEYYKQFDFVKIGSYQKDFGGLDKQTTNQRLFYNDDDITYKFW